jgi:formiminotetrahydrofolate cyclodeaminase
MALGNMVGSLTVGKPKYADVEPEIIELKAKADGLQKRLLSLIGKDARVFEPLSEAYGLPKGTDAERVHKAEVMEACLRECCDVPLRIMEAGAEAIDLHERFAAIGAAIAISDVGCGAICCKTALQAASLNVFINTMSMTDRSYADGVNAKADALLATYCEKADGIFSDVLGRFSR